MDLTYGLVKKKKYQVGSASGSRTVIVNLTVSEFVCNVRGAVISYVRTNRNAHVPERV